MAKSWLDNGFRTWADPKLRLFYFNYDKADMQGDIRRAVTIHLFRRAFQFTIWDRC